MKSIFPSYFCSLITPPNKDEMLKGIKNAKIDKKQEISWNKICRVKVDVLHPDEIIALLSPSLSMFFREWGFGERKIELLNVWKNTYKKGMYQEVHDHLPHDISGCIFFEDYNKDSGKFYFQNRHSSDIGYRWKKVFDDMNQPLISAEPRYKKGDIIFFPSHMLHGVTTVLTRERITVSFNINFI